MRYHAILRGQERLVEITPAGTGYKVVLHPVAGSAEKPRALEVDAVHLQGHAVSLLSGTRSARVDLEPGTDGKLNVLVGSTVHALEILDERHLRMRRATGKFSLDGPQRIDAPMPGKIVRVLVKLGDEVAEGQGLVVVEAMKMENELRSPKAGKVTELSAQEGAPVESGARLVVVT